MGKIDSEKVAEEIISEWLTGPGMTTGLTNRIAKALDEAYQRGRDEMREEAAHKACDCVYHVSCKPLSMDKKGQYIAKQIRSLK